MPIEVYVVGAILVVIIGVIVRISWLKSRAENLEKDISAAKAEAGIAKAEVAQVRKTDKVKAEVVQQLRKEHIAEQAKMDSGFPRDQFDTEEF